MALSAAFRERLEHMEHTRNQRLSLLQAEREQQATKSQMLASKLADIRSMDQRCLLLDRSIASQNFKILALKSEIQRLDSIYQLDSHQLRVLKSEVEELEEAEKEKERFCELKGNEMKVFRENMKKFVLECQIEVNELRNQVNELNSIFMQLQGDSGYLSNSEIAKAEMRKEELLAMKEDLDRKLNSNHQIRSQLQIQLQNLLSSENQQKRKTIPVHASTHWQ